VNVERVYSFVQGTVNYVIGIPIIHVYDANWGICIIILSAELY